MILAFALPALAAAEDWSNVSMIDTKCSAKVKADPDSHTRACAMAVPRAVSASLIKMGATLSLTKTETRKR